METRVFYKTSEFWLMVFTNLMAVAAQIAGSLPSEYALPAQAAINLGYVLSRGIAKSGVPATPPGTVIPTVVIPVTPVPPVPETPRIATP